MVLESIMAVGGLIVPPAVDFLKKKFLGPKTDTPEATLSALATTSPDMVDKFVSATAELFKAQAMLFNKDVIANPSQWIIDLRAAIRPVSVVLAFGSRVTIAIMRIKVDEALCGMLDMCITSFWGGRF